MSTIRLPVDFHSGLSCPVCHGAPLRVESTRLTCESDGCGAEFPVVDGCPIMINDQRSVFRIDDFEQRRKTTGEVEHDDGRGRGIVQLLKGFARNLTPSISYPVSDYPVKQALATITHSNEAPTRFLVVGAGEKQLQFDSDQPVVYTDVDMGPLTHIIADAHDIPFQDETFDAVICDSVLEHVVDPVRCVEEIFRVLRPSGFVYSITPFMQQVHMGRYDFMRFTHLGHRRLFRHFDEIASGVSNGPGMALAWSAERFLAGFFSGLKARSIARTLARFVVFPAKYFDRILARQPSAFDGASAYYFFGTKSSHVLSDRELVRQYRGVIE